MFINVLKIRLQFLVPERCKDIVRNEAHVRMATSVWYATRWLITATFVGLIMAGAAIALSLGTKADHTLLSIGLFDVLILVVAVFMKFKIEKFIHYLRVREVVYVLETADFAVRNGYDLGQSDFVVETRPGATDGGGSGVRT